MNVLIKCPVRLVSSRGSRAFSLVQLLATIAILAVLVAILLPTLSKVKERANITQCVSNIRQIGSGYSLYLIENDNQLPAYYAPPNPSNLYAVALGMGFTSESYLDGENIFHCTAGYDRLSEVYPSRWDRATYHQNRLWASMYGNPLTERKIEDFQNPSKAILVYEQWGPNDRPPLSPDTHDSGRSILYTDMHVEFRTDIQSADSLRSALREE